MMAKDLLASLAAAGKTVLYSSHVLDVVERFCDRVLIIHHGNLIADGSPSELKVMRREASLEGVFRDMTQAASAEPLVSTIMESLQS
jgi:ABC-2 type transport system ATP-binding protein